MYDKNTGENNKHPWTLNQVLANQSMTLKSLFQ